MMTCFEAGKTYIHYNGYAIKRMRVLRRNQKSIRVNLDGTDMTLPLRHDDKTEYISRKTYTITARQVEA